MCCTLMPKGLQSRRFSIHSQLFCNHTGLNHLAITLVARVRRSCDQSHGSGWGTSATHHTLVSDCTCWRTVALTLIRDAMRGQTIVLAATVIVHNNYGLLHLKYVHPCGRFTVSMLQRDYDFQMDQLVEHCYLKVTHLLCYKLYQNDWYCNL